MNQTNITDRGVRKGDYYVIRENRQNAVLVELGFLSNPIEEILVTSQQYQVLAQRAFMKDWHVILKIHDLVRFKIVRQKTSMTN